MKHIQYFLFMFLLLVTACYDDEGNYSYSEIPEITVSNVSQNPSVYRGVEDFVFNPTVTSSTEGEISADDANYEYSCRIANAGGGTFSDGEQWHEINVNKTQSFTYEVTEPTGTYTAVYSITDKRTGVQTNYRFTLNVSSSTYEGWMVLCNEGAENKARLDMVSVISTDRIEEAHNLFAGLQPDLFDARQIAICHVGTDEDEDFIYLVTGSGTYRLDRNELTYDETGTIMSEFATELQGEHPVRYTPVMQGATDGAHIVVTDQGNVYIKDNSDGHGAIYQFPANAPEAADDPTFHVAPYIGVPMARTSYEVEALFYDTDNKRFMKWWSSWGMNRVLSEIPDEANAPFSFSVGKDLVYMESSRYSKNVTFAVMEDDNSQRSIYGVNLDGFYNGHVSALFMKDNITAEGFNQAQHYTFHSQFPYVFYSNGSNLYTYQYEAGTAPSVINLPGEEITMVKMNIFSSAKLTNVPEEKEPWQYYVLVGSYKNDATDNNGGILRMYQFDNTTGTLNLVHQYDGFAKIVDVTYRERF